ncbi:MAG: hypothetical protein VR67_06195 [Peptococcaceae bacterium BRH_c8a]|nr:MAG: hypothetical protein VR67_06195 [Peptococcaceae bacterium BRH_c8a]
MPVGALLPIILLAISLIVAIVVTASMVSLIKKTPSGHFFIGLGMLPEKFKKPPLIKILSMLFFMLIFITTFGVIQVITFYSVPGGMLRFP